MTQEQKIRLNPEEMQARIEELAEKDELTARELKEFVFLIHDKTQADQGEEISYEERMFLPSSKDPKIIFSVSDRKYLRGVYISLVEKDRDSGHLTGEMFLLQEVQSPEWYVGVRDSAYFEFLGRRAPLDIYPLGINIAFARDPLTDQEHAKLVKLVYEAYKTQPQEQQA